jgi:hypothetical protein
MSIPLDRLYHYIESIAKEIRGDNVIIYRFYPHGSKNVDDLHCLSQHTIEQFVNCPHIICYDQEPLNYDSYKNVPIKLGIDFYGDSAMLPSQNLRTQVGNIYDHCLLLHSEKSSSEVITYQQDQFVPVYYWSHALIARDWFRYAQHETFKKNSKKTFLIYNRAWCGTREYRLKFAERSVENNLLDCCKTNFKPYDNKLHYNHYIFNNPNWQPVHKLEQYLEPTTATSNSSADFDVNDYNNTEFEIVLETLFDDTRQQLTEKILRPIACKQPFILASTAGSLKYLQHYGFKTFGDIIDESYDTIHDPVERMKSIIKTMRDIASWSSEYKTTQIKKIKQITEYNHLHFFSDYFFNTVVSELKINLFNAFEYIENNNIGLQFRNLKIKNIPGVRQHRKSHTCNSRLATLEKLKKYRKKNRTGVK